MAPRLTALAPQFLVDDLEREIAFYRDVLGFTFGFVYGGFYAVGQRDGRQLHLKEALKNPASVRIGAITSILMLTAISKASTNSTRNASPKARAS